MALRVQAGTIIRFLIHTQNRDTLAPLGGAPVFLDRFDQPAAAPVQVAGAETDAEGNAFVSAELPTTPGTYRFRSRTPGLEGRFRPDTSPQVAIEAVAL